ncbi:MAG: hypothetical protein GY839_08715 [candidate division Zixibacteria bacterium]|nr:hypothetical protein [candidate division Zixibacteria bacterium]
MNDDQIQEGEPLTDDDTFWLDKMKEITGKSIDSVEEAAKQLIGMITVMQGIYAAVLAFSGIKEIPQGNIWYVVLYALPIFGWLAALFYALRVLKSKKYRYYSNSPDNAKETYQKIADFKYTNLTMAYWLICGSFLIVALGIGYWLYLGAN